ncbi:MAG TPA: DUF3299 domain-containing protein [Verrucomicrobiae bacterium]|nr:DUF3299 domain-containing protein [Verrucomicrobiae bacterium]
MGIAISKQQVKTFGTGAIVLGLVLLPGLASFVQQQILQRKMARLNTVQTAAASAPAPSDPLDSKYTRLQFDTLKSWTYIEGKTPIPGFIKKLDGQNIEMVGFMMPLSEVKNITEFILVPSLWGCCYGQPPAVNHVVVVKMPPGQTTKFYNDVIRVRGKFAVGETKQDGYTVSLYVLTPDKIDGQ